MKRRLSGLAALLFAAAATTAQTGLAWGRDLAAALEEAREGFRLVAIETWDEGALRGGGKSLAAAYRDPRVLAYLGKYVRLKIEPAKDPAGKAFLDGLELTPYPSLVLVDCIGRKVTQLIVDEAFYASGGELAESLLSQFEFYDWMQGAEFEDYAPTDVEWRRDIDLAYKEAEETGRKLFVYVTLNMCHAAIELVKEVFADGTVSAFLNKHFVPVKLSLMDLDREGSAAERLGGYGIDAAPTVLILDRRGRLLEMKVGYSDLRDYKKFIDRNYRIRQ